MLRETARRHLALLRLEYGVYHSPTHTALHRVCPATIHGSAFEGGPLFDDKKRKYTPADYFRITLTSDVIAEGATGRVHNAKVEVQADNGYIYGYTAIAKIARQQKKRQKLRHEFAVYLYMAQQGVNSVANVYGLFEDAANEALVLIMSHAGMSLVKQPHYRQRGEVSLTDEQKYDYSFLRRFVLSAYQGGLQARDGRNTQSWRPPLRYSTRKFDDG